MELHNILEKFDYLSIDLPAPPDTERVVVEDEPGVFLVVEVRKANQGETQHYLDNAP
jgi:hypothetical protein